MQKLLNPISVLSLLAILFAQAPAWAHYDLQDHRIYDSARVDSTKPAPPRSNSQADSRKRTQRNVTSRSRSKNAKIIHKPKVVSSTQQHAHWISNTHSAQTKVRVKQKTAIARSPMLFNPWKLFEFAISPAYAYTGRVSIVMQGPFRVIHANGIPDHPTGAFPNEGNPNTISEQQYEYRVPKEPLKTGQSTPLGMSPFGVAINGVPFDPGAAEWWQNNPQSGWQYEAMYLGARLGLDQNNAHVQPNGAYHYHGIPNGLMQRLSAHGKPVLIGYAADGFPIYGPYGYKNAQDKNSGLKKLKSSYKLKSGNRPSSPGPGGRHDGAFTQDYEYTKGLGDLDDCNGLFGITPEYPQGIYHYVVTDSFPYIPRGYKGSPDQSFMRRRPGMRPGGPQGQNRGRLAGGRQGYPGQGPEDGGPPDFGGPPFGPPPGGGQEGFRPPPRRPGGAGGNDDGFGPPPRRPGAGGGGNDDGFGPPPRRPGGGGNDDGFGPPPHPPGGGGNDDGFGPPPRRPGGGGNDDGFGPPPRRPGGGGNDDGFGPPPQRPGGGGNDDGFGPPPRRPGGGGNDDGFGPPPHPPGVGGNDDGFGPPRRRPGSGGDD